MKRAFSGCTGLTSVVIPNSVTEIGPLAFSGCGLTSLEIPPSLSGINTGNYGSFSGCVDISKLVLLGDEDVLDLTFNEVKYQKAYPFSDLMLEELYLGRIVDRDGFVVYSGLGNLKKITFGEYLNKVGTGVYCYIVGH